MLDTSGIFSVVHGASIPYGSSSGVAVGGGNFGGMYLAVFAILGRSTVSIVLGRELTVI